MNKKTWRDWIGREVIDTISGMKGRIYLDKRDEDLIMDEGGIIHKEEVVVRNNRTNVYLGDANTFEINYQINEKGEIFCREI